MEDGAWRTIVTNPYENMRLRNNNMVLESKDGRAKEIPLNQIRSLLINADYGMISLPLLSRLAEQNSMVLLCDKTHKPNGSWYSSLQSTKSLQSIM